MQKKEESPTRMHERGVDAPLEQKVNIIAQKSKERAACDLCFCFSSFFLSFFLSLSLFLSLCAHVNGKRESNKVFPLIFDTNPKQKHTSQKKKDVQSPSFCRTRPARAPRAVQRNQGAISTRGEQQNKPEKRNTRGRFFFLVGERRE